MNERTNTPVARIDGVDEYGPRLGWFEHWARIPIGTLFYAHPSPEDTARLREDLERVTRELEEETALRVGAIDRMKVAERERDDARKALETANGLISDARGAWWYARNEAKGGHLLRIWDRLVAADDAARSASREGASDE